MSESKSEMLGGILRDINRCCAEFEIPPNAACSLRDAILSRLEIGEPKYCKMRTANVNAMPLDGIVFHGTPLSEQGA